ncbi:uncharacterized protein LAESUDRAFT_756380 [Laetiporus sulphureus 93-53]|uniref:RRM domain-containing protein n=1 Tax=Laetiporus sulphureus 93-53 TaxID=1314785 RepID=A0A165GDH6_9APHY|nr:uncharacterized protein LAESUDRAFT_756380 [Laetiporus sulphureus 93-53]KZT10196.1 hypothetical protein LAESUDRAFT_756380 [Laetiporus sulphureus 93-53]
MDEVITKRLHVSGLTPAITPADLSQRLSGFGTVKALDGFGLLDALGQPRKFGYVTLETTTKNFGRCMNLLGGVTYKGAKLRIGEAKPDFRERIAKEHEAVKRAAAEAETEHPNKRRRLRRGVQGVYAEDMSLVTSENASSRPGWKVTATGRIVHPITMRPTHPLPEPLPIARRAKSKDKDKKESGREKSAKAPPTRAWRRTIDPTKWGSQHLKGAFLDSGIPVPMVPIKAVRPLSAEGEGEGEDDGTESSEDEDSESGEEGGAGIGEEVLDDQEEDTRRRNTGMMTSAEHRPRSPYQQTEASGDDAHLVSPPPPAISSQDKSQPITRTELLEEKEKYLGLLRSLFGDKDDDWGGEESIGSDVEMDNIQPQPEETPAAHLSTDDEGNDEEVQATTDAAMDLDLPVFAENYAADTQQEKPAVPVRKTNLKDLFAPREEEAGFSLLGHLDVDFEIDEDVDLNLHPKTQPAMEAQHEVAPAVPSALAFDPNRPMFFPLPPEERAHGLVRDAIDPTNWRSWFYRTASDEEIQKRWEETRRELTSGWKRRHREAVKSRRRRGGGPGENEP